MEDKSQVEVFRIDAAGLTTLDDVIPVLKTYKNIRRLYLRRNKLKNIPSLAFLPNLELLDLSGNPGIDDVNMFINNLKNNEQISYLMCKFQSEDDEDNVIVDLPTLKIVNGMSASSEDDVFPKAPELGNDLAHPENILGIAVPTEGPEQPNKVMTTKKKQGTKKQPEELLNKTMDKQSSSGVDVQRNEVTQRTPSGSKRKSRESTPKNSRARAKSSEKLQGGNDSPVVEKLNSKVTSSSGIKRDWKNEQLKDYHPVFNAESVKTYPEIEQLGKAPSVACMKFFKQLEAINTANGKPKETNNWRKSFSSLVTSTKTALYNTLTNTTYTEQAAMCKSTLSEALIWISALELMNNNLSTQIPTLSPELAHSLKALLQTIIKSIKQLENVEDGYINDMKDFQEICEDAKTDVVTLVIMKEKLEKDLERTNNLKSEMENEYENKIKQMSEQLAIIERERDDAIEISKKYERLFGPLDSKALASLNGGEGAVEESSMINSRYSDQSPGQRNGSKIDISQLSTTHLKDTAGVTAEDRNRASATLPSGMPVPVSQMRRQSRLMNDSESNVSDSLIQQRQKNPNSDSFINNYKGPRILNTKMLNDFITQIVESKITYENKRERIYNSLKKTDPKTILLPGASIVENTGTPSAVPLPETMEQHLYTFLCHKYGLRHLVLEWADSILASIAKHSVERKRIISVDDSLESLQSSTVGTSGALQSPSTIPRHPTIVAFSYILRSECEESFLEVLSAVRNASIELLLARIKASNPLKGDKWAMEEVNIRTGEISVNTKNSQSALLEKEKKKSSKHNAFVGYLSEAEWTDIVKYMYSRDDSIELINRCRSAAETEIRESGIPEILGVGSSNAKASGTGNNVSVAELSLIGMTRKSIAELRRTLREHPSAYLRFDTFICILQAFQLEGHLKFLSSFVERFKSIDTDRDGILNELEFRRLCDSVCVGLDAARLDELADLADPYGSNAITFSKCVDVLHDDLVRFAQMTN